MSRRVEGHLSGGPSRQGAGGLRLVDSEQIRRQLCSGQMLCWGAKGGELTIVEAAPCHGGLAGLPPACRGWSSRPVCLCSQVPGPPPHYGCSGYRELGPRLGRRGLRANALEPYMPDTILTI